MIQDIITLSIVFASVAYAGWSLYASLTAGSRAKCDGCKGCAVNKDLSGSTGLTLPGTRHSVRLHQTQ
jgi:hypothetical protein